MFLAFKYMYISSLGDAPVYEQQDCVVLLITSIFISYSPHSNQTLSLNTVNILTNFANAFHISISNKYFSLSP